MRTLYLLATLPFFFLLASCEQEEAAVAHESLDHMFLVGEETTPYNFGYEIIGEDILTDGITTLHQYEFMLLEKDIFRRGYLSGVSDMMAINILSLDGPVTDFDIDLDPANINPDDQVHIFGRYCKSMNFSLGTTDEDVMISSGEMSLTTNDDGSKTLRLNAAMSNGKKVIGTWTGEFVPAKTGY